ncbi:MFS transporter [Streptomyces iconiensis]|uniref:MFS transporter n=1 Tax=Streptomyces iconiensis TaxID=1384038 RepID=A0ABT7A1P5_9ACTN|nr:MFS transporter [Streptomyces iconiensis]MDJ1134997.1 MFS transporter [Streptomyces iconiensis]
MDSEMTLQPPRAGRREWIGLVVLTLPMMLTSIDTTVLHLALPHIGAALEPSGSQLLWIVDIYALLLGALLLVMGTLGERVGRRRLLLIGAAGFGATSILAAYSTSAGTLIFARALLGLFGATLMPSTLSLLRNMFHDPKQRTAAISFWMASSMVGTVLGPAIGGIMLDYFWWGSVFLMAVPVMALLLFLGPAVLPEYRNPESGRLGVVSVVLLLVSMLSVVYGIQQFTEDSSDGTAVGVFAFGLVAGGFFVWWQGKEKDPLLDLRLFGSRTFSVAVAVVTLGLFAMSGVYFLLGQFLQSVGGMDPGEAGLAMMPTALASIVGVLGTPVLLKWIPRRPLITADLTLAALAIGVLTQIEADTAVWVVVVVGAVVSLGIGGAMSQCADMIMGSAPVEKAGRASAIQETATQVGVGVGIAVLGGITTAVYRAQLSDQPMGELPGNVARAAEDTVGAGAAAAGRLGGSPGDELLHAVREAFTSGVHVTATVSGLLMLGVAVLAGATLRNAPRHGGEVAPGSADAEGVDAGPADVAGAEEVAGVVDSAGAEGSADAAGAVGGEGEEGAGTTVTRADGRG